MILTKMQYYKILKQVSIWMKANSHPVGIGSILAEIGLDEYVEYTREITLDLEGRLFVETTNIHDGHKLITRLLPAAIDYLEEYELSKVNEKPKTFYQKWKKKVYDYLETVILVVIREFIKSLFRS